MAATMCTYIFIPCRTITGDGILDLNPVVHASLFVSWRMGKLVGVVINTHK